MFQFPLQPDDSAQHRCQHEPRQRARDYAARHLGVEQVDNVLPVHGLLSALKEMAGFYHWSL